jgi:NitT/TauT family transport system substrate-binding protein
MAQGIAASDQLIQEKPQLVRKFVHAALKGMKDITDDPNKAAEEFVTFVPDWKGKEAAIKFVLHYYAEHVYPGQSRLGEVNPDRLIFYVAKGLIQKAVPVDELYSNAFIR